MGGSESSSPKLHRLLKGAVAWLLAGWLAAGAMAQSMSLRYHTQSDGLANLVVTALLQTPDGQVWIGTENGLYRHDGARIVRIDGDLDGAQMLSRQVCAIASDGRGGLWIAMRNSILHMSGGRLDPVDTAGEPLLVRQGQTLATTADGGVLVVTTQGLYRVALHDGAWRVRPAFEPAQLTQEPSLAEVHSIFIDVDGAWWMGCGTGLCHWQAGALRRTNEGPPKSHWGGLLRSRGGALWVRSQAQMLRRAADADDFEDVTPPGLSQGMLQRHQPLAEDGDGRILTRTDTGLVRWQSGRWEPFGADQGLTTGGGVHAILLDRDQDIWLGTSGQGLAHWQGYRHWRQWTQREGVPGDEVWSFVEEAPGRMWLGSSAGAVMLREGDGPPRLVSQGGPRTQVGSMTLDAAGQLWMSTFSGELFRRLPGGAWQRVADHLPMVLVIRPAPGGGLWVGTNKGGYFVPPSRPGGPPPRLSARPDAAAGLPVYAICTSPQGRTWFATGTGLLVQDPGAQGLTPANAPGLPSKPFIDKLSCGRDGVLWVGSRENQLWRMALGADGWRAQALAPGPALGRRSVMALLADRRGWLWASTDDGVLVWNGRQWRRFDEGNGLAWNDCSQSALYEDAAGNIWIGTSRGASQVLAPERLFDPVKLELRFTGARRDGQALPHDQSWTAAWSAGALQIAWAVPTFVNRPAHRVRYRLRGLSEEWTTTQHDDVSFSALPGGHYTLEAQAENDDLGLASTPATLSFEIRPPWWLSRWALAAEAAAALALMVLGYRWRVRLLVRRQRELEGLVGQRTAELQASYEQMRTLALTDALTGAMNRRAITDLALRQLAQASRGHAPVTLMLLDVDHFKRINDAQGHPAGDAVLTELVRRLRAEARSYDAIGRWGGEEFLLVLPGLSLADADGRRRAESLQRCVAARPFDIGTGTPLAVSCSAGAVSAAAGTSEGLEALIARVDAALYDAKHGGRNRTVFAS